MPPQWQRCPSQSEVNESGCAPTPNRMWVVWQYDTDACIINRFRAHQKKTLFNCWFSCCYSLKYGTAWTQASSLLLTSRSCMGLHWHYRHPCRLCSLLPQNKSGESGLVSGADRASARAQTDREVPVQSATLQGVGRDHQRWTAISVAPTVSTGQISMTAPQSNSLTYYSWLLPSPSQSAVWTHPQ